MKTLLIFCGGTISMHKNPATGALETAYSPEQLLVDLAPRYKEVCEVETLFIDNIDSTNMTHLHWEKIVDTIYQNYSKYDGFVVTTGTNTMAYASAALSFALQGIGKPVVLTGAQIPAEMLSTDAKNNFINALRMSVEDASGVFIVFGSRVILGCRAKKVSESELDAFKTFNQKDFGEIGVGFVLNFQHPRHTKPFSPQNGFEDKIACLTLIPGLNPEITKYMIDKGTKGIIFRAYGSGDMPYDFIPVLKYAQENKVPVVVTTQCPGGATVMGVNDVGLQALNTGVIQTFDMCMEAMSTKLMWLLGQKVSYEEIKEKMQKNFVGEVDSTKAAKIMGLEL